MSSVSPQPWYAQFLRTSEGSEPTHEGLARTLGVPSVLLLSIGAVIGTGIFVILGVVVPLAGPAVVVSFALAGVASLLSGLCYAEIASTLPSSGSVYSYAYASVGELIAWVVGWCLVLEYGAGVAAVSVGWSQYLVEGLHSIFGITLPEEFTNSPINGGFVDLPALLLVLAIAFVLTLGAKESARLNAALVVLKIALLALFVVITIQGFSTSNLNPFVPLGIAGVMAASSKLVFAYAGFDAAAVAGAESKNPKRTVPIAIIGGLIIVMVMYVVVALVAVAAVPWQEFIGSGGEAALAQIANQVAGAQWPGQIISAGAVLTIMTVVLASLYTLSRLLYTMSRDGLLPKKFASLSPKRKTPVFSTWSLAWILALLAGFVPLDDLAAAISLGTLVAFCTVAVAVMVLRKRKPDLKREFRLKGGPTIPILALCVNVALIISIPHVTWIAFTLWLIAGLLLYWFYGRRKSNLATRV